MSNTGTAILERLVNPKKPVLSIDAARTLLALDFPSTDHERVAVLSGKAQEGALTKTERAELEEYLRVADLLAMLQSKARLSLERAGLEP